MDVMVSSATKNYLMKFLLLPFMALLAFSVSGQTINKGDNVQTSFKNIKHPYFFEAPKLTPWAEGSNMLLVGDKPNPNNCDYLFVALKDTTLVGVYKLTTPNYFLLDTEGNSVLGTTSDFFLLPSWALKRNANINSSDRTIVSVLDDLYQTTMQANDGQPDEKTIQKYQQFQTDITVANRHIALLFDTYQMVITETAAKGQKPPADICVPLMKNLAGECIKLYDQIPAIVCVYMGEALQSAGMTNEARTHFQTALQFYPNSVPLQVYNYRLEQDTDKQKQMLTQLKKKHSKHWMVKDL
jgi:hypothetical protein